MASRGLSPRQTHWLAGVWIAVGLIVLAWVFLQVFGDPLRLLVAPVLLGSILIYLLAPVVDGLSRMGIPRLLATLLTYLLVIGVMVLAGLVLVPLVSSQVQSFVEGLPDILMGLRRVLDNILEPIGLDSLLPPPASGDEPAEWVNSILEGNGEGGAGLIAGARAVLGSVVSIAIAIILAPVLAFYVLADLPRITSGFQRLLPPDRREEVTEVGRRILSTVGAYFRGQLIVAAFVGVATSAGLAIVGLPFWALVGGIAGVFNLIPFVGPFIGAILGVLVALTVGGGITQAAIVVVVMVVVQQIDNHIITPSIISRTVHVHPVTIIISLTIAASLMGIVGMLVVIPTVAALKLVMLYILSTRVPAMAHLSDPEQFLDGVRLPPAREGSLAGLSQQLRRAWEERRFGDGIRRRNQR